MEVGEIQAGYTVVVGILLLRAVSTLTRHFLSQGLVSKIGYDIGRLTTYGSLEKEH
jgi:hypothetical protein